MKKLYRSRSNRMVSGICGGLAEYMETDPTIIRIIAVILLVMSGFMPMGLIYLIGMMIIPNEEDVIKE